MKYASLPTYQLQKFESSEFILKVGLNVATQWKYSTGQIIRVRAGMGECKVKVVILNSEPNNKLSFSSCALNELRIPNGSNVRAYYDSVTKSLRLGPIIGLYAIKVKTDYTSPFGEITSLLQELIIAGELKGALVYVFCPQEIPEKAYTLVGYIYSWELKKWLRKRLPIPDVVYDRILSRKLERKKIVQSTRKKILKMPSIHYFNQGYLDKWNVYKHLSYNNALNNNIPETRLCKRVTDIVYMLRKYPQVYIKPANSSHGLGICWVSRKAFGYQGHYINWQGEESAWQVQNLRQLLIVLSKIIGRKKYIIQQGLYLASKGDKPADIRVLMQKNGSGEWKFTTFIARIAAEGSKVSNFEHGGSLVSVYKLLKQASNKKRINYKAQKSYLINFSKSICEQLESSMNTDFAELGLDLAIDVKGHLWLIEVNSRPARDLANDKRKVPQNARLSVRRIIDYAAWLSGFTD